MIGLSELSPGARLIGVIADGLVTVVQWEAHGDTSGTLTYRTDEGQLGDRILTSSDFEAINVYAERRWTFDADGAMFRLASEARRMKWAHLSDPFAAVDTSNIEPYPHQIDAVYNRFLKQRPLRFLLADDPGAGKTIMAGLLIRELMLRGDVARCLVVAPGSLVEQWQDELFDKFGMNFELMSRAQVQDSRTGNPFLEKNLLIARIDQLARAEDLTDKLKLSDWDLVIVDEAHKMSAHQYGPELRKTKRFQLGEVLRERTRHFLLLSATPHNGKNEDFLAFITLIDPERFAGQLRNDAKMPETADVMRRLVKENLLTFEGKRLFTQRFANTLNFELSEPENNLYEAVTEYVRNGMNRAARMQEEGDKRRGIIIGFALAGLQRRLASSPAAIYHSLRRRRERLQARAEDMRRIAAGGTPIPVADLPKGIRISDLEDFDFDDYDDDEIEALEDAVIDTATAAATAEELELEIKDLARLVSLADIVRNANEDTKWIELRNLLRDPGFRRTDGPTKLIVFSEHKDTLTYVAEKIAGELGRPEAVVTIHGGVRRHDRREIQDRFRVDDSVEVLVATDAAGEGINLQVANMMVNYDLPWNPNRIEQRFGRIHRIGQDRPCHLWNLVAHRTREGQVFHRLFEKIEEQRGTYGDQVYDVLGDSHINTSLQDLLLRAIREDGDPNHIAYMEEVIEQDIGKQLESVLKERALVAGLGATASTEEIRRRMELSRAKKLQPGFVGSFFRAALELYGGRITRRESGRYEIRRMPAAIRSHANPSGGPVHVQYSRVTFDKEHINIGSGDRAELISPGSPVLNAVVDRVLADHGSTLQEGAMLVDLESQSTRPRLLVYLDHKLTDGRTVHGQRQVVSRQFQYVEIDADSVVTDPGIEPYINYAPINDEQRDLVADAVDYEWANAIAEALARDWAIEHLAQPHFETTVAIAVDRVDKVRAAVTGRLRSEIAHWDQRAEEIKAQELKGKKPPLNSGRARQRADELEARMDRRHLELDQESDIHNRPPTIVGAAMIIPQGLLHQLAGNAPTVGDQADKAETNRRAVEAVMSTEKTIGRDPKEMDHSNPGYDILSVDHDSGMHYFIEVKGHLPQTKEIHVSAAQVNKAKANPERWRLVVVSVPEDLAAEPTVHYLIEPFAETTMHFAQTAVPMTVAKLLDVAGTPR